MTNRQLATDITDAIEVFVEAIVAHNAVRIDGDLLVEPYLLAANVKQARRALVVVIATSFMLWDYQA